MNFYPVCRASQGHRLSKLDLEKCEFYYFYLYICLCGWYADTDRVLTVLALDTENDSRLQKTFSIDWSLFASISFHFCWANYWVIYNMTILRCFLGYLKIDAHNKIELRPEVVLEHFHAMNINAIQYSSEKQIHIQNDSFLVLIFSCVLI